MTLIIREESKYYSAKEIEMAIRKCIVFSGQEYRDPNTGFTMSVADNGSIANNFIKDFFAALKDVIKDQPEKTIAVKNKDIQCTLPECN